MSKFLDKIEVYNNLKTRLQQTILDINNYKALKNDLDQDVVSCKIIIGWVGRDFGGDVVYGEENTHEIDKDLQNVIRASVISTIKILEYQKIEIENQIKEMENN